jgi:hypothetical protein
MNGASRWLDAMAVPTVAASKQAATTGLSFGFMRSLQKNEEKSLRFFITQPFSGWIQKRDRF